MKEFPGPRMKGKTRDMKTLHYNYLQRSKIIFNVAADGSRRPAQNIVDLPDTDISEAESGGSDEELEEACDVDLGEDATGSSSGKPTKSYKIINST